MNNAIQADTNVPLTVAEMAKNFDVLGNPAGEESVDLGVDPDDFPGSSVSGWGKKVSGTINAQHPSGHFG